MEDLETFLEHTRSLIGFSAGYFGRLGYRNFLREAGDVDAAMKIYGKGFDMSVYISPRDSPSYKQYYTDVQTAIDRRAPLVAADDKSGVGDVLRDMERVTARKLGMEHLWEPTPFPFEANDRAVGSV